MLPFIGMGLAAATFLACLIWYLFPQQPLPEGGRAAEPAKIDAPPLGSLRYVKSWIELHHSQQQEKYSGRIKVELKNDTDKMIYFYCETAGRINDVSFDKEKVKFDGFIQPHESQYLFSTRLPDIPITDRDGITTPSINAFFEYDIRYRFADQREFSRKTARGIHTTMWLPIKVEPAGTKTDQSTDIIYYNQIEE
jgi:hypothetical protein